MACQFGTPNPEDPAKLLFMLHVDREMETPVAVAEGFVSVCLDVV